MGVMFFPSLPFMGVVLFPSFAHLSHSVLCNFSERSMSELFVASNKITNQRTTRHLKTHNTLFKITHRGLLVKTLKVFCIPSMV